MQEQSQDQSLETIDLRQYIRILSKWKWLIIMLAATAVITSGIISFFVLSPVYQSKTILMVTQGGSDKQTVQRTGDDLESVVGTLSRLPEITINSYVGQLKNLALLEKVVQELKLEKGQISAAGLAGMIEAKAVKDTNLIEISVNNTDPKLATTIANTLSQEFLGFISQKNQEQMTRSVGFLEKQVKTEGENLRKATEALKTFQAQPQNVTLLDKEVESKSQLLTNYQSQLIQAQIDYDQTLAGKGMLEKSLAQTPKIITINKALTDEPAVKQLAEDAKVTQGNTKLTVKSEEINPAFLTLVQQLDVKNVALAEKKAQVDTTKKVVDQLQIDIRKLQSTLAKKRINQTQLEREADRLEKTYALLSEKKTQTQIAKSIDLGSTSLLIVSEAYEPAGPVKPNKKMNIAIAGILGVMLAVGLAFLLEYLNDTVNNPDDIRQYLDVPLLGTIPVIDTAD